MGNIYSQKVKNMTKSDSVKKYLKKQENDEYFVEHINALFFMLTESTEIIGVMLENNKEHYYYLYKHEGTDAKSNFSIMLKIRYVFNDIKTIFIDDLYKKAYSPYHTKDD